jgi:hypothetical protein
MSTPYRQIRALYDQDTITVYQASNSKIAAAAVAAVAHQKLNASPLFRPRMTWIKPSYAWMLYRSGYSYKDSNQSHILALKITHAGFLELLRRAELSHGPIEKRGKGEEGKASVRVQWDPERSFRIGKLEYRSIQIGIPASLVGQWIDEWIVGIEDVTEQARLLKKEIDENENVTLKELKERGLFPNEEVYEVDEEIREILQMDGKDEVARVKDEGVPV